MARISVLIADDSVIVREGLRALLSMADDIDVVGVAGDYDELVMRAEELEPQVVVTDIRMPPTFQQEGLAAARLVRKRHPGTGIVVLSQYDDPDYAVSLLSEGAAGCAYLLKDRVAQGDQLAEAIRAVVRGDSVLDPEVVAAMLRPVDSAELSPADQRLLQMVAAGRTIKAIAAIQETSPAVATELIERLFLTLARHATIGADGALRNLRLLHQAIVEREEQGEVLSRMLPGGIAERLRARGGAIGDQERMVVTVLMSDVRGFSAIAQTSDPSRLAGQVGEHRAAASHAIMAGGGTVMQFVGDAVMAVFGAPEPRPEHADLAVRAACAMQIAQADLNLAWVGRGLPEFHLGIGLSTGLVAAAILGGAERMEYSLVGDPVNLAQRLQELAAGGQTVVSEATFGALTDPPGMEKLEPTTVNGRRQPIRAYKLTPRQGR
jgi:class 3 adenylate cyclase/DNA-binding NarL/FixJ family response regulator